MTRTTPKLVRLTSGTTKAGGGWNEETQSICYMRMQWCLQQMARRGHVTPSVVGKGKKQHRQVIVSQEMRDMVELLGRMKEEEVKDALLRFAADGYDVYGKQADVVLEDNQRVVVQDGRRLFLNGCPEGRSGAFRIHYHDGDEHAYIAG